MRGYTVFTRSRTSYRASKPSVMGSSRKSQGGRIVAGLFVLALMAAQASLTAGSATAANQAANIDQCANGGVGPPLELKPCADANWVNGNVNGSKAHWKEGD